jgi:hypothetical protein
VEEEFEGVGGDCLAGVEAAEVFEGLNPLPPGHQPPQMIPAHVRVRLLEHPAATKKGEETD